MEPLDTDIDEERTVDHNESSQARRANAQQRSHGYVDRRAAEDVQHERARRSTGRTPQPDSTSGPGRGLLARLRRLLPGGGLHRTTVALAVLLIAAACGQPASENTDDAALTTTSPAAEPEAGPTTESEAQPETRTVRCDDGEGDLVVFQDRVPTSQEAPEGAASDLVEVTLVEDQAGFRMTTRRAEGGPAGAKARFELHLQSVTDVARTGVVALQMAPGPNGGIDASVGPTTSELSEVETTASHIGHQTATATIAADDLPVAPPFHWYFTQQEPGRAGDVCPDVTGFTADAELPAFGADGTSRETAADTIAVTGIDYAFQGLPSQVSAGTRLEFANGSDSEAHELVLIRMTDQTPPVEELLRLPMQQGMEVSELVGVSIATPGEQGRVTKGDLLLDQPGQYLALCAIPVGAPPEHIAADPYGPPEGAPPPEGPPHFVEGMLQVIEVTD